MIGIIFSKNRGCQLELLLRSMKEMFLDLDKCKITILYTYSTNDFKRGYEITKKLHPEFKYILETSFRRNLLEIIRTNSKEKYLMFFVDDMVWKSPFTFDCPEFKRFDKSNNIICLSLRLSPDVIFCFAKNAYCGLPQFEQDLLIWDWKVSTFDWGYPMSVDGHIFRLDVILPLLESLDFSNPNGVEGCLAKRATLPKELTKMICFEKAKTMTLPFNLVQSLYNRHGTISAKYFNDKFLNGYKIDLGVYINLKSNAVEEIKVPLKFVKRDFSKK